MTEQEDSPRDLAALAVARIGAVWETGDLWEPYQLVDGDGAIVGPVAEYLKDLQAAGRPAATQRSYAYDLLRWFRFGWAVDVVWSRATRVEARDFCRWIQIIDKPVRPTSRSSSDDQATRLAPPIVRRPSPGTPNPVTGKPVPTRTYAPATALHCGTVLRSFYEFHLQAGTGPMANPFPLARAGRAHAHHNPRDPFRSARAGLFRPRLAP